MMRYPANERQRGFSLVAAIFVLVVFALLGAFMLTISAVQHATSTYAVQGVRAYQAAASGIEWGVQRAIATGSCAPATSFPLDGFTVSVQCSVTQHAEPGVFEVFVIAATATSGTFGTPDYFSRRLGATVTNAP